MFVPERLAGLAAPFANAVGKLDHLVDGLFAVEAHDVLEREALAVGVGLARQLRQQLGEHGRHDIGPAFADERERAVEVEEHVADLGPRREAGGELDASGGSHYQSE